MMLRADYNCYAWSKSDPSAFHSILIASDRIIPNLILEFIIFNGC